MSPDRCESCGDYLADQPATPGRVLSEYCERCRREVLANEKLVWLYLLAAIAVVAAYLYRFR